MLDDGKINSQNINLLIKVAAQDPKHKGSEMVNISISGCILRASQNSHPTLR